MNEDSIVATWVECWNLSRHYQPGIVSEEMQAERWNKRSVDFARGMNDDRRRKKTGEILKLLSDIGFKPEGARVLDIGCGPGTLSIPLAKAGAQVTALDIASGMLDRLRETASAEDLKIQVEECSWWTADIDTLRYREKFDLVIASMTPGVRDAETFDRMMACSKHFCYYSNFIRRNEQRLPSGLYSILGEEEPARNRGNVPAMLYPFMYLYTLGHRPKVNFTHSTFNRSQEWREAADHAIERLEKTRTLSEETREQIRQYFRGSSEDGMYHTNSEAYTGMMAWSVREKD